MVWTAFVLIRMGAYMYSRNLGFLRGQYFLIRGELRSMELMSCDDTEA